jgi:phosphatidylglycerophosphate synthase
MTVANVSFVSDRQQFRDAVRSLTSVLTPLETRTLIRLAHRMPPWVNSDHLTGLALVAMLLGGLSYWLASITRVGLLLAVACLAVNWFGDSLDGTLARVRHQQRPRYGFYVDHIVDAFGALFLVGGLSLSRYMTPVLALVLLAVYLMLLVEAFLATHVLGTFRMSFFKIGPTELRLLLAIGNVALLTHPTARVFGHTYLLFDVGGAVGIVGLLFTLVFATVTNARGLYRAEPLSRASHRAEHGVAHG